MTTDMAVLILGTALKKECGHLEHVCMRVTGMVKGQTSITQRIIQRDQGNSLEKVLPSDT